MEKLFNIIIATTNSILTFLKILLRSTFVISKYKTENEQLFILGNGPSLKHQLPLLESKFRNSSILSVNGFPLSDLFEKIKPNYFIVCSPGFYRNDAVDYNVEVRKNIIKGLVEKTTWPIVFFIPAASRKNKQFTDYINSNQNITLQYYNTTPAEGLKSLKHLFYNMGLGSPRPHNVLIPSILQAINAGYKKIYLLGADHSWLPELSVNDNNEVLLNQKHFYDEHSSTAKQMHKQEGRGNRKIHEVLHKFMLSFNAYHELNEYASTKDSTIINLTEGSFIDAFEKKKIASL